MLSSGATWRNFGAALSALGLSCGDRVAVYLDKRIETVTALFGVSAGGGVFVPVNPLLRPRQVGYILQDCDVRVLVTSPERLALLREELEQCKSVEHVVLVGHGPATVHDLDGRYEYTVNRWPLVSDSRPLPSPMPSMWTWPPSCIRPAAPASPREWCSATGTSSRGRECQPLPR